MQEKYKLFTDRLSTMHENGEVKILYRGMSKKTEFETFNIDLEDYNIEQFAQKLFFFGNKSVYFVREKYNEDFKINDISPELLDFIFDEFFKLRKSTSKRLKTFIEANKEKFSFFFNKENKAKFIESVLAQNEEDILITRNYLFSILHQIGNFSKYKKQSHFLSSTSKEEVAKHFSKEDFIIKFWEPILRKKEYEGVYLFNSFVYAEQEESSIFTAIFPHYILSFTYKDKEYFNPHISSCIDLDFCIYFGFDINQENFISRLHSETILQKGVEISLDGTHREI